MKATQLLFFVFLLFSISIHAQNRKGPDDQFDISQFHDQFTETACVPLAILKDKINN